MGIRYDNLDETTRRYMLQESRSGDHYLSKRLNSKGRAGWVALFEEAVESHDDDWLAEQLELRGMLSARETYILNGKKHWRKVASDAAQDVAGGQFNRYYLRALCLRAQAEGIAELLIYRGKRVNKPRPESDAIIGRLIPANFLLDDLQRTDSVETALGVPGGPNSGITCRLPDQNDLSNRPS